MHARRSRSILLPFLLLSLAWPTAAAAIDLKITEKGEASCLRLAKRLEGLERTRDFWNGKPSKAAWFRSWLDQAIAKEAGKYADTCVRLDQIQVIGTHNSYHLQPRPTLFAALVFFDPMFLFWEYTHRPLAEQFGTLGIRQIELDVFRDPEGGLYGHRAGLTVVGEDPLSPLPEMFEPGLKVLHVQDLDFETHCPTLQQCLGDIRSWSDANPAHLPIFVLVELKDDPIPDPVDLGFVTPIPFDGASLDTVDAEIRAGIPAHQRFEPDDLRAGAPRLEDVVLENGWPTLGELRGKVIFAMDNGGSDRLNYIAGRPNLEGRVLFTNGVPGEADAAFVKRNDPIGSFDDIQQLVADGYLVRTRADADTDEARSGDTAPRDAALASGAQFVSTDYPEPDPDFGTGYSVTLEDGRPARCNPISAPRGCRGDALPGVSAE